MPGQEGVCPISESESDWAEDRCDQLGSSDWWAGCWGVGRSGCADSPPRALRRDRRGVSESENGIIARHDVRTRQPNAKQTPKRRKLQPQHRPSGSDSRLLSQVQVYFSQGRLANLLVDYKIIHNSV
eukprot:2370250-Pyramimonas_sp.AAC.2